jgi:hypothetical protein
LIATLKRRYAMRRFIALIAAFCVALLATNCKDCGTKKTDDSKAKPAPVEVKKPEVKKPEAKKPEVMKPAARKPEATQPKAMKPAPAPVKPKAR